MEITSPLSGFEMEEVPLNLPLLDKVSRKEPKTKTFPSLCNINLNYISGKKLHLSII